jgi:hypothetical protein
MNLKLFFAFSIRAYLIIQALVHMSQRGNLHNMSHHRLIAGLLLIYEVTHLDCICRGDRCCSKHRVCRTILIFGCSLASNVYSSVDHDWAIVLARNVVVHLAQASRQANSARLVASLLLASSEVHIEI